MFAYNKSLRLDAYGLEMFLLPYQVDALEYLYTVDQASSRDVWQYVNRPAAPDPKSRASVINLLEALRREGLVESRDATGKGGHHSLYARSPEYPNLEAFTHELVHRLLKKLSVEFHMAVQYVFRTREGLLPGKSIEGDE